MTGDPPIADPEAAPTFRQALRLSLRRAGAIGACLGLLGLLVAGWRGVVVALIVGVVFGLLDVIERLARRGERSLVWHVLAAAAGWLIGFATVPFVVAQTAYTGAVAGGGSMDEAWGAASQSLGWLTRDPLSGAGALAILATPCAFLVFVRARGLPLGEQLGLAAIGAALLFGALAPLIPARGGMPLLALLIFAMSVFVVLPIGALGLMDWIEARARRTGAAPPGYTPDP